MNAKFLCTIYWDTSNTISAMALVVSSLTLSLGYLAYKKFLLKQAQQKQLDIVLDLIKHIHADRNECTIYNIARLPQKPISLFGIVNDPSFNTSSKVYFIKAVEPSFKATYEYSHEKIRWSFYDDFYLNPLLPNDIAQRLKVFKIDETYPQDPVSMLEKMGGILIGNINPSRKVEWVYTMVNTPLANANTFKEAANELKEAIIKWLESYGIKRSDINLNE